MGISGAVLDACGAAWRAVSRHAVLAISAAAALASMILVPPDAAYAGYFDMKTLVCLFCILAVVGSLRRAGAFERAARLLVRRFKSSRAALLATTFTTAVISMFATNDMALIMMLPLTAAMFLRAGWTRLVPAAFVLQSLAANLGGMIMPFGNPQNLYLFSYYDLSAGDFAAFMLAPFAVSMAGIALAAVLMSPRETASLRVTEEGASDAPASAGRTILLLALLALVVASVLGILPAPAVLLVVAAVLLVADARALCEVDYALLLTFACFFIFAGNVARIPEVDAMLGSLMESCGLLVSAGLSQVISNVPAAVLLSHFTDAWQPLLWGVNIGGAGTPVGSLASLITLQHFMSLRKLAAFRDDPAMRTGRFLALFLALNFAFLIVLLAVCSMLLTCL